VQRKRFDANVLVWKNSQLPNTCQEFSRLQMPPHDIGQLQCWRSTIAQWLPTCSPGQTAQSTSI